MMEDAPTEHTTWPGRDTGTTKYREDDHELEEPPKNAFAVNSTSLSDY